MRNFLRKLFPKYYYEQGDTIYIKRSALLEADAKDRQLPILMRVAVVERKFSGYIVEDADGLKYFIKNKYVVSKVKEADA